MSWTRRVHSFYLENFSCVFVSRFLCRSKVFINRVMWPYISNDIKVLFVNVCLSGLKLKINWIEIDFIILALYHCCSDEYFITAQKLWKDLYNLIPIPNSFRSLKVKHCVFYKKGIIWCLDAQKYFRIKRNWGNFKEILRTFKNVKAVMLQQILKSF